MLCLSEGHPATLGDDDHKPISEWTSKVNKQYRALLHLSAYKFTGVPVTIIANTKHLVRVRLDARWPNKNNGHHYSVTWRDLTEMTECPPIHSVGDRVQHFRNSRKGHVTNVHVTKGTLTEKGIRYTVQWDNHN